MWILLGVGGAAHKGPFLSPISVAKGLFFGLISIAKGLILAEETWLQYFNNGVTSLLHQAIDISNQWNLLQPAV